MKHFRHKETGRIVTTDQAILINEYQNNADFAEITEWAKEKLQYIEYMYGKHAAKWEIENDDRKIYANIYNLLHQAVIAVSGVDNNTVYVAMNNELRREFEVMEEIIARFK